MLNLQHLVLDPIKPRSHKKERPPAPCEAHPRTYPLHKTAFACNHQTGDLAAMLAAPWKRERWVKATPVLVKRSHGGERTNLNPVRGKALTW